MAVVIRLATIVRKEPKRVVLDDMLRVVLHKLLDAIPQSGNGLDVLVQAKNKAVLLALLVHQAEGVVVNITEQLDAWLHTPVVVVVHHKRLAEEEARLETTHMTVADRVTVDNLALLHVLANPACLVLVDVRRKRPVFLRDLTIMRSARHERGRHFLESRVEWLVVQEHPVIVVAAVEAVFDLADRARNFPNV